MMCTELFRRTIERADEEGDQLMREVWESTPWMVNAFTDSIGNHGTYPEVMNWCRANFGSEAWFNASGQWRSGNATIHGWTWMGFATKEMMDRFCQQWQVEGTAE
jgi:hypothetical protein